MILSPVEYIDCKITICPCDNISLIYSCWVTYGAYSDQNKNDPLYLGGRIELSISSVCCAFCASTGGNLLPPFGGGFGTGPPLVGGCAVVFNARA